MQEFLFATLHATLIQILGVLGIFFVFGFVLSKLQTKIHRIYTSTVGWKGILWTAWLGTPIHEIGHVVFALIFHHRIDHISLFKPNEITGGLGHVDHRYHRYSPYQQLGNFFIGAAPMIFGSLALFLMLYFLLPNGAAVFAPLTDLQAGTALLSSLQETLANLFASSNLSSWSFWLFLYISFCIVSHIAPSKQDQRGMWRGFVWLVGLLLIINAATLGLGYEITELILSVNQYLGIVFGIFTYALLLSLLHLLAVSLLFPFIKKRSRFRPL